jgi:beta-galactosidase
MESPLRRPDLSRFAAGLVLGLLILWSRSSIAAATPAFGIVPIKGWRYTTSPPADGWRHAEFSDASWQEGAPGFGNSALPALQQSLVKTPWTTADVWVRGVFELDRVSELPALRLSHDDDVEVFVNGVLAFAQKGFITDYEIHLLNERASQALHTGKNAIAAHCHQIAGGQFLDVQVIKRIPPARRSPESIIQELGPVPRPEHPRPDRLRPRWLNLNGVWEFAFDPNDLGLKEAWNDGRRLERRIMVPFCPESVMSGVGDEGFHTIC